MLWIDIDLDWQPVAANIGYTSNHGYYAAPLPHLLLLRLPPGAAPANLYRRVIDAEIGWYDPAEYSTGRTLPEAYDRIHHKLEVRGIAPSGTPYDTKLSAVLANAPTLDKSENVPSLPDILELELPPVLVMWLENEGAVRRLSKSQVIWEILMEEATRHE